MPKKVTPVEFRQRRAKFCCQELYKALQYEKANIRFIGKNLITLSIGYIRRSPKENFKLMEKLIKAMRLKTRLPKFPTPNLSNKTKLYPVFIPIRFCPFCGKRFRKDLAANCA